MSKSKTAREALTYIKANSARASFVVPLMIDTLIKHFEAGKGLDDVLEMSE